jgi:hypothetical protein
LEDEIEKINLDEEEGFLDLIESSVEDIERSTRITLVIGDATQQLGERMVQRTKEIEEITRSDQANIVNYKRVVNASAEDLNEYTSRMRIELPRLAETLFRGLERFGRSAILLSDFQVVDIETVRSALNSVVAFRTSLEESLPSISRLRDVIKGFPRITTKYNHAKREAVRVQDQLISELERAVNISREIESTVTDFLSRLTVTNS